MKKILCLFFLPIAIFSCNKEGNKSSDPSNGSSIVTDIDGVKYKTVVIGKQEWMAENLKVTKFNDGTPIPNLIDENQWRSTEKPALCDYKNDPSTSQTYGKLYNWYTVDLSSNGNKNVCPSGWHVPSGKEWKDLSSSLGGSSVAGGKMMEKGTSHWTAPNEKADNSSLFTALPAGSRQSDYGSGDGFYGLGSSCNWWSTTKDGGLPGETGFRYLQDNDRYLYIAGINENYGYSIRCLKD
jgi:uncharacterized protein (TIGR02145 family)